MKKQFLYLFLFFLPIIFVVSTNEIVKLNLDESHYKYKDIDAINNGELQLEKCTWKCHNNTDHCKENHVKLLKPYFIKTDLIYFAIISSLKSTGNYGLANVIFLVIFFPLIIYVLLVKSISIQFEITSIKKRN